MLELVALSALAGFITDKGASIGMAKGVDWITHKNKPNFITRFTKVIDDTIKEFKIENFISEIDGRFPFYESQLFLEELLTYRFFSDFDNKVENERIISKLSGNQYIILPEKEQLSIFLEILERKISTDEVLKDLAYKDNFQEEIFFISGKLFDLYATTIAIKNDTETIIKKLDEQNLEQFNPTPKELTSLVRIKKTEIVGRRDDLYNLRQSLLENNETVVINGMGGIGKTTLAAVYVDEFYNDYDHIVWLTIETNLDEAIIANSPLIRNMQVENADPREQVALCLNKICNLQCEKQNLFVIDNAQEDLAKQFDLLPKKPNWHLLVTSRKTIPNFKEMKLGFLTKDDAVELYKKFHNNFSEDDISLIVKDVEYHTLTIEILAKSAHKNRWTLDKVTDALSSDAKAGVNVKHNSDEQIDRIKSYLTSIFDISDLNKHEIYLLKQFTALPNQYIEYELLSELLQSDKLEWSDEFAGTLEELHLKGFILKETDEETKIDSYKMHPVLVEALLPSLNPVFDDVKLLVNAVSNLLEFSYVKDNPIDKFKFIPYGELVLKLFLHSGNFESAILKKNLAIVYREFGEYVKARDLLEETLKSDTLVLGKGLTALTDCQTGLGLVCQNLGEYEKARDILKSVVDLVESSLSYDDGYIALCRSNLATVYLDLNENNEARNLLEDVLQFYIIFYGVNDPSVARCQSNLALAYSNMGNDVKAKELLVQAIRSDTINFHELHPQVVMYKANLSVIYGNLREFENAKEMSEQALHAEIMNRGENHPYVARCQNNLAHIYFNMGEPENALELWENSYIICLSSFSKDHQYTVHAKECIEHCKTELWKKKFTPKSKTKKTKNRNRKNKK